MKTITLDQARKMILRHQKLYPAHQLKTDQEIVSWVDSIGCIQFDPLDQVGTNPNLVLQARVKDHREARLQSLLYETRQLIDGWDKQMSIYPSDKWPHHRVQRDEMYAFFEKRFEDMLPHLETVRQWVRERGPSHSKDLPNLGKVDWYWSPTDASRAGLDALYEMGELVIHHRVRQQKYYELTERLISPDLLDQPSPFETLAAYHEWFVYKRIQATGLLWNKRSDAFLGLVDFKAPQRKQAFEHLLKNKRIIPVRIQGLDETFYAPDTFDWSEVKSQPPYMTFIAPLDPLIWDRALIKTLFNFEYVWEVYVPQKKRKYGYYVLPVLYGDTFVARAELKRDKKTKTLTVINWFWEEGIHETQALVIARRDALKDFAAYLLCQHINDDN